jgi:hypothetical protein
MRGSERLVKLVSTRGKMPIPRSGPGVDLPVDCAVYGLSMGAIALSTGVNGLSAGAYAWLAGV